MTWAIASHRCWCHHLVGGRTVRDTRSWDAVTGRCGRCGLLYRQQVRVVDGDPEPPPRPVRLDDIEPTEPGEPDRTTEAVTSGVVRVVPFRRGR